MGFLKPNLPVVDVEWTKLPRAERIVPMARHIAENGFGTPLVMHVMYGVKIVLYVLGGMTVALATKGIDGFTKVGEWWSEPIVFQKAVLFTMLFEVVGLGCCFGPLAGRYFPPMGSILYWLRPGTIRLPPWPNRVPLTKGHNRTPFDALLYGALVALLVVALVSDGSGPIALLDTTIGVLPRWRTVAILAVLAVLSLRDKVIFLAARGEVYAPMALVFLFSGADIILGAKVVFLVIWLGAAVSKLNKHFPFVISTMLANNPFIPSGILKRSMFVRYPDDLRPSALAGFIAHFSTAVEGLVPLVLFFSHGGRVTAIAAFVMVVFHLNILLAFPMGVPLEWNVFMIFGVLWLFVGHAQIGLSDVNNPAPVAVLFLVLAGTVVIGNLYPHKVSFLPGMRYYAGNWDTTIWCVKPSCDDKFRTGSRALGPMQHLQLERLYGSKEETLVPLHLAMAFRAMNTHGRALFTLVHRALAGHNEDDYNLCEGEVLCSMVLGWNFGDGHMHNECLIEALQERCHFQPGDVRVIILDAQPIHKQVQEYRLVDAATGEFERGHVDVAAMATAQPWADDIPIHVASTTPAGRN
ncbi:hypothetical protein BST27_10415 [Mycobacterium intermedium]|uniref:DUF3556 domain-containing protein n=1 Tax=Mycobacterium intermedium TaxID=28445 RepID=A0A1E3SLR4_MYCIE|nr:DUF3556 domain-containing protein [Mycobacterium intermedium]MCV6964744.1 DUF3556 domain-containing protein [Mycobacterium intermedium]ODR03086.1 hypothetical protein BHQ20_01440 [Mycobacterium intermedium]OPE49102.1 hypothetical protein BV508_15510 [Mycobacterium intermedium]ORB06819.1 hypothetical protein BST27_10415 [Mycobacterium intermedium]